MWSGCVTQIHLFPLKDCVLIWSGWHHDSSLSRQPCLSCPPLRGSWPPRSVRYRYRILIWSLLLMRMFLHNNKCKREVYLRFSTLKCHTWFALTSNVLPYKKWSLIIIHKINHISFCCRFILLLQDYFPAVANGRKLRSYICSLHPSRALPTWTSEVDWSAIVTQLCLCLWHRETKGGVRTR